MGNENQICEKCGHWKVLHDSDKCCYVILYADKSMVCPCDKWEVLQEYA